MVSETVVLVSVPAHVFAEMADEIERLGEAVARLRTQLSSLLEQVDGTETLMGANADAEPEVVSGVDLEPLARVSLHAGVADEDGIEDGLLHDAVIDIATVVDEAAEQFALHDDFIAAMSADERNEDRGVRPTEAAADVTGGEAVATAEVEPDVEAEVGATEAVDVPVVAAGDAEAIAEATSPEEIGQECDAPADLGEADAAAIAKPEEATVIVISNPVLDLKVEQPMESVKEAADEAVAGEIVAPVIASQSRSRRRGRWVGVLGLLLLTVMSGTAVLLGVPELALAELASALS